LLLEMLRQLRDDFAEEREQARESRSRTHERIDDVVDRLGRIDTSMALAGEVDAQVRTELDQFKASLSEMQPTVGEWQRIRTIGVWAAGILLSGGIGVGAIVAATGDWLSGAIRHWLKIN
jgi:predicted nuclease with TOPRIM domain